MPRAVRVVSALLVAAAGARAQTGFVLPPELTRPDDGDAVNLWRLPALDSRYPAPASVLDFAAELGAAGATASSSLDDLAALHTPLSGDFAHDGIHAGVGYVSLNYSAAIRPGVVHLDQFALSLFAEYAGTVDCTRAPTPDAPDAATVTLTFTPPAPGAAGVGHSADDLALVLGALVGRLAAANATFGWGPRLGDLGATAPACAALANGSATPHFAVADGTVAVGVAGAAASATAVRDAAAAGAVTPITLTLTATPVSPFAAFTALRHAFVWQPNMTRALAEYPHAPLILTNGTVFVPGVAPGSRRRLDQIGAVQTGDGGQSFWQTSLGGFNWNYGGSPGVAHTSPVPVVSGTPASQLGCYGCYAHFDVSVFASLDIDYGIGWFGPYLNVYEMGAYVQGTADVRGTVVANSPTFSGASTFTLLNRATVGTIIIGILIFNIPIVTGYVGVDVDVSLSGTVDGTFTYGASFYEQVTVGLVYNTRCPGPSGPFSFINSWPGPTVSAPAPDFSGLTAASVALTVGLRPTLTLAPLGVASAGAYATVDASVYATVDTASDACPEGVGAELDFDATVTMGVNALSWGDAFGVFGLGWLAPGGNVFGSSQQAPASLVDMTELGSLCVVPAAATSTPSPSSNVAAAPVGDCSGVALCLGAGAAQSSVSLAAGAHHAWGWPWPRGGGGARFVVSLNVAAGSGVRLLLYDSLPALAADTAAGAWSRASWRSKAAAGAATTSAANLWAVVGAPPRGNVSGVWYPVVVNGGGSASYNLRVDAGAAPIFPPYPTPTATAASTTSASTSASPTAAATVTASRTASSMSTGTPTQSRTRTRTRTHGATVAQTPSRGTTPAASSTPSHATGSHAAAASQTATRSRAGAASAAASRSKTPTRSQTPKHK